MNEDRLNPILTEAPPASAEDEDRAPTREEIMDDIRQGLRDVLAGKRGRPARESIAEIRRRVYGDAEDC